MQRKKWHVPFSLGSLMIMAMLSVSRKHSSYVAVRLSGITETRNILLRWFSVCARRTGNPWESSLESIVVICSERWHIWLRHPQQKCY